MSTDAELVAGVLAGDREAFAGVYDRYADRLFDFCYSVLRDRQDAEDAVQDTFVLVAQRLSQLNDPERLRPWLYAVARSVAFRRAKTRKRVVLDAEVSDMVDPSAGPQRAAEQAALRDLVWSAAAGLSERDRALLDLHLRQGLDGAELGEAMGVSSSHAYVLLTRLRDQVERSLGALLIARLGRKDCVELDELLSGWDGKFSPLMRKRVARHVDSCDVCTDKRRAMISPLALLAAVPLITAPLYLRDRVLDNVELVAYDQQLGKRPRPRPSRLPMAAAAATLLVAIGVAAMWDHDADIPGFAVALDLPAGPSLSSTSTPGATTTTEPSVSSGSPTTTTTAARSTTTTTTTRPTTITTTTTTVAQPPPPPADTTPPQLGRPVANPARLVEPPCGQSRSTVSVPVTDNVGVTSVTLRWSGKNNKAGSTGMKQQPNGQWQAVMGPFAADTIVWSVAASDAAGNTATSANNSMLVDICVT
jgi:RNA polymerase sigma factor (sigma-70 family)